MPNMKVFYTQIHELQTANDERVWGSQRRPREIEGGQIL